MFTICLILSQGPITGPVYTLAPAVVRTVQIMQNKAARCVTKQSWFTPTQRLLLQCNWLSIKQLIFLHTALQIWRVRTTKIPAYIDNKLQLPEAQLREL